MYIATFIFLLHPKTPLFFFYTPELSCNVPNPHLFFSLAPIATFIFLLHAELQSAQSRAYFFVMPKAAFIFLSCAQSQTTFIFLLCLESYRAQSQFVFLMPRVAFIFLLRLESLHTQSHVYFSCAQSHVYFSLASKLMFVFLFCTQNSDYFYLGPGPQHYLFFSCTQSNTAFRAAFIFLLRPEPRLFLSTLNMHVSKLVAHLFKISFQSSLDNHSMSVSTKRNS